MAYLLYSYLIGKTVPLLDESEWKGIGELLRDRIKSVMAYRKKTGCDMEEAMLNAPRGQEALARYQQISGQRLDHPDELHGVRLSRFGSLCPSCKKPFRTPKAKMCAECGFGLPEGEVAGPALPVTLAHLKVERSG